SGTWCPTASSSTSTSTPSTQEVTGMSDSESTPRRGRRARALTPEERAALESRTASMVTGETSPIPGVRGPVAAPEADAPVPKLRTFGRRARIIELTDPLDEHTAARAATGQPGARADPGPGGADGPGQVGTASSTSEPRFAGRTATIDRDRDGVELGELSVAEAPDPRPAPRFDGKVLHRPERSGGRSLLWVVWALIAVALIVLIVLMVTGVLGQDSAAAAFTSLDLAAPDLPDLLSDRPVLKEAAT